MGKISKAVRAAQASPLQVAASDFAQKRSQKRGYWGERRQELLSMVSGLSSLTGMGELGMTVGSGMANMVAQELSGAGALLRGQGVAQAEANRNAEFIPPYIPRTQQGMNATQGFVAALSPANGAFNWIDDKKKQVSEGIANENGPLAGYLSRSVMDWAGP